MNRTRTCQWSSITATYSNTIIPVQPPKGFLTLKKAQQNADGRDTYAIGHFFAANGKLVFPILATTILTPCFALCTYDFTKVATDYLKKN